MTRRERGGRVCAALAALALLVALAPRHGAAPARAAADSSARAPGVPDTTAPPPPGRLIDLGGYRLHLWCTGRGGPTVVLVPGIGGLSFGWALVQPAIAKETRVCSCDRGGMAWSDLGPRPRTKTQEAYDLRRLLIKAGEPGPYVLVGQSMGGDVIRLFAADYPSDVAGMILVDSATPEEMTNLDGRIGPTLSFSRGRTIPAPGDSLGPGDRLAAQGEARIREAVGPRGMQPRIEPPYDRLSPEMQRWRLWALAQPKHFVALESGFIGEEAQRVHDESNKTPQPLANVPLVVLCRDTTVEKTATREHVTLQAGVARLSRRGRFQVVTGAGHQIQLDKPEAVIEAIREVVADARRTPARKD